MRFQGLEISAPKTFVEEESSLTLRAPMPEVEGRLLNKQMPVRNNLIVNRRHVGPEPTIASLTAEVAAELRDAIDGVEDFSQEAFSFADGIEGQLVSFQFPFREAAQIRQFHALRLDDETFTTLTLTVDGLKLNDQTKKDFLQSLSATRVEEQS